MLRGPDRHLTDGTERVLLVASDALTEALAGCRTCRECGAMFNTNVPSAGSKWTDCCTPCLRAMGCL